jgi:hypothetical protein
MLSDMVALPDMPVSDLRRAYEEVGHCIYCAPGTPIPTHLGDEHIIPLSFGGGRILPRASCRLHEKITTQFEDHCFKGMMETARYHMGLRGRNKFKNRNQLRALLNDGSYSDPLPLADHPSALIMPVMPPPTVYAGIHETEDMPLAVRICITPMGTNIL